ncbi:MAG: DUF2380 domain-containing protein [candidate division Zixibacteria bacterium]|nr:DUF2380 domain-containing protein [candidate division Zixibacteria bacterium]
MKRIRIGLLSIIAMALTAGIPNSAIAMPSVAVMDFIPKGVTDIEASALTDRLRSELVQIGQYRVVEREMMNVILAEQGFQLTGCVSDKCIVAAGQILGAAYMVAGSISKIGETYSVNARLLDVESGEIIKTAIYDYRGDIDNLLSSGMKYVAARLLSTQNDGTEEVIDARIGQDSAMRGETRSPSRWPYRGAVGVSISSIIADAEGTLKSITINYTRGVFGRLFIELEAGIGADDISETGSSNDSLYFYTTLYDTHFIGQLRLNYLLIRNNPFGLSVFSGIGVMGWQKVGREYVSPTNHYSKNDRENLLGVFPIVPVGINVNLYSSKRTSIVGGFGYLISLKEARPNPWIGIPNEIYPSISPDGPMLSLRILYSP